MPSMKELKDSFREAEAARTYKDRSTEIDKAAQEMEMFFKGHNSALEVDIERLIKKGEKRYTQRILVHDREDTPAECLVLHKALEHARKTSNGYKAILERCHAGDMRVTPVIEECRGKLRASLVIEFGQSFYLSLDADMVRPPLPKAPRSLDLRKPFGPTKVGGYGPFD